ncbi:MAG: hypothetical protein JNM72_21995 [Deltaproteobacteria bacterium]|nr:hypothetical protein [Deltaproteobacteria bacterium]
MAAIVAAVRAELRAEGLDAPGAAGAPAVGADRELAAGLERLRGMVDALADRQDLLEVSQAAGPSLSGAPELRRVEALLEAQAARAGELGAAHREVADRIGAVEGKVEALERAQRAAKAAPPQSAGDGRAAAARMDGLERALAELRAELSGLSRRAGAATGRDRELQERLREAEEAHVALARVVGQLVDVVQRR